MPGTRCAVAICNNSLVETKKKNLNIIYHTFPKHNDKILKAWISACHRKDNRNPQTSVICSQHFNEDDYEVDLRSKLMNIKVRPKLKPSAVPSLFLKPIKSQTVCVPDNSDPGPSHRPSASREERMEKRSQKSLVQDILSTTGTFGNVGAEVHTNTVPIVTESEQQKSDCSKLSAERKLEKLLRLHQTLKEKYKTLQTSFEEQKKHLEQSQTLVKKFEEEAKSARRLEETLNEIFTKSQRDLVIHKKRWVKWSSEDISRAFTLRYLSKRCYLYLRNSLKYPLPHVATLVKWASTLNFRQGVLSDVIRLMKIAAMNLSDFDRVSVLQFDEMKVLSTYEYDKPKDEIVGPYSQMQVMMVRGLFCKWKQPVFIGFDQKVTKDLLLEILFHLDGISYEVVAVVSDCGGGNLGLWRDLNISIEQTYFLHPCTKEKIFFFADILHLLKLLRNWLIDTGFVLEDGSVVNKKPLEELIKMTSTEVSSCHKLTQKHIDCQRCERQNVGLASQLISHTTSTALQRYKPGENKVLAANTGRFIGIMSTWFDIMNSYTPSQTLTTKKPYGLLLEEQNTHLNQTYNLINGMRCSGKLSLQVFQKGISFFSQIRSRGGLDDHPSPLNCIYRIRLIVLGKNPGVVQERLNIQTADREMTDDLSEEYLLSNVMKTANVQIQEEKKEEDICLDETRSVSDTSISSGSTLSSVPENELDGFHYLCGWIARKFKQKYPEMGQYTKDVKVPGDEHSYQTPTWLKHLSFGGLTEPSHTWYLQARKCEKLFSKYHQGELKKKNCVKRLTEMAKKQVPNVPEEVLKAFFIQRTYIRLKWLNSRKQESKGVKRKRDSNGDRKIVKK